MKRLHTAALAAFLTCSGLLGGIRAEAYYFTDCAFALVTQGGIAYYNTGPNPSFQVGETGNCGGGTVQCCVKITSDLATSTNGGTTWTPVKTVIQTFFFNCNTNGDQPNQSVDMTPYHGLYRLTAKMETCGGVLLHNFGSASATFP